MKPSGGTLIKPGHPHTRDVVASYPFNAFQGPLAYDYAPFKNWLDRNHALIGGATWGGGGLIFDGEENVLNCGSDSDLDDLWSGGGTIIGTINVPASDGGSTAPRFCSKRNSANTKGWDITIRNEVGGKKDILFVVNFSGNLGGWQTTAKEVPVNSPAMVSITYNSDNIANNPNFFVNKLEVAVTELATPTGGKLSDAGLDLLLGNRVAGSRGLLGFFENFIVYDRLLSDADILQYNFNPYAMFERPAPPRYFFVPSTPPVAADDPYPPNCTLTATGEKLGTINPKGVKLGTIEAVDTMIGDLSG